MPGTIDFAHDKKKMIMLAKYIIILSILSDGTVD